MNQTTPNSDVYTMGLRLWADWTLMWNGRPELARTLVAEGFVLHLPSPSSLVTTTITGPEAVEHWVRQHRASFKWLTFHTEAGPFVDERAGIVAGPWFADTSLDGSPRPVCGMDTIAFAADKITEYWTLSKEVDRVADWPKALRVPRP